MRDIIILGATGSIGTTCLNAIREHQLPLFVKGVVASSSKELKDIAEEFGCPYFHTKGKDSRELRSFLENLKADIVLNGIAGSEGLEATLMSLDLGFDVALANKESVVLGGEYLFDYAKERNRRIIPVDSEHSCLYNLLKAHDNVERLIITASGGPFYERKDTSNVTLEEALNHPTWKMGRKITIDSATLANKGLEVIEAGYLFGYDADHIDVTVHRQSVVHSMVQLRNGAYYAQLTPPDMTLPIIGALADGKVELKNIVKPLDLTRLTLTFGPWTKEQFPLLGAAYDALRKRQGYPILFNMSNEVAVHAFLDGKISFDDISRIVLKSMESDEFDVEVKNFEDTKRLMKKATDIADELLSDIVDSH